MTNTPCANTAALNQHEIKEAQSPAGHADGVIYDAAQSAVEYFVNDPIECLIVLADELAAKEKIVLVDRKTIANEYLADWLSSMINTYEKPVNFYIRWVNHQLNDDGFSSEEIDNGVAYVEDNIDAMLDAINDDHQAALVRVQS